MYLGGVYRMHISRWSIQDICIQVEYIEYIYPGGVYRIYVSRWGIQDTCIQVGYTGYMYLVEYTGCIYPNGWDTSGYKCYMHPSGVYKIL